MSKYPVCIICGRPLENPESIARGMGPTCAERVKPGISLTPGSINIDVNGKPHCIPGPTGEKPRAK